MELIEVKWVLSNLPFDVNEDDIAHLFEDLGKSGRIYIVQNRDTGRPTGVAFVELLLFGAEKESFVAAYGRRLRGRPVKVRIANRAPESPQQLAAS